MATAAAIALAVLVLMVPIKAEARCARHQPSWRGMIVRLGGYQTRALLGIYRTEGLSCYVGDHGTSFGPFQLHYGGGLGDTFTRQTGLHARNQNTVPAQIIFMRRWGAAHGGFSHQLWHGLHARYHHRHHRR